MGVHSGKFGMVNGHTAVFNWAIEEFETPEQYRASNTVFGHFTNSGVGDWNGSFSGFGGAPPDTLFPGESISFSGYTAPGTDIFGNDGVTYAGSAIVDSLIINWSWLPSQSLTWTCNFSCRTGDLTPSTSAPPTDTAVTIPQKMCGLKLDVGASGSETDWDNVVSASLSLLAENTVYVNSSTNCFVGRKAGPTTFTLDVTEQNEARTYAKGSDQRIRCYVTPTTWWLLEWCHLTGYTGMVVDRDSGVVIEKTANFVMQGSNGSTLGQVLHPNTTSKFWPETSVAS